MALNDKFTWLDYLVFGITVVASVLIGITASCCAGKKGTVADYFLGNRKLAVVPVAMSLLATGVTSIDLLGTTAEMYFYGTQMIVENVGTVLAYPIPILLVVPLFYPLKITSLFQYFPLRFNSEMLHKLASVTFVLGSLVYNAVNMYAPSTAFEAVTGIPFEYCLGATGFIVTLYTAIGGIRGVVWTDLFQSIVLIGGLIALVIVGCEKVGGLSRVWEISQEGDRIIFFDLNPDPFVRMTFWTALMSGILRTIIFGALGQVVVQRYMSVSSVKKGMILFLIKVPGDLFVGFLLCISGLTAYAYYADLGCDPLEDGQIRNANQILPYFMIDVFDIPGIPGLFIAVLFSACLSTNSSTLNAGVTVMWKGFLEKPLRNFPEYRQTLFVKILTLVFGAMATGVGFLIPNLDGHVAQMTIGIVGGLFGPIAGIIMTGIVVPFVNWKGMLPAYVMGLVLTTWISIGKQLFDLKSYVLPTNVSMCEVANETSMYFATTYSTNYTTSADTEIDNEPLKLYELSFMYTSTAGFIVTALFGMIFSLLLGPAKPETVDPRTVYHWENTLCCRCCSKSTRHKCMCGYDELGGDHDKEITSSVIDNGMPDSVLPINKEEWNGDGTAFSDKPSKNDATKQNLHMYTASKEDMSSIFVAGEKYHVNPSSCNTHL